MSNYTSVILIIPGVENEIERIAEVNSFELRGKKIKLWDLNDTNKFPDIFPRSTYAGTFNDFNLDDFLKHLQTKVKWENPEYVQLLIKEEGYFTCKIYSGAGQNLEVDAKGW